MSETISVELLREMSPDMDKFRAFEREVIGGVHREIDGRKEKLVQGRVAREKKAKRKRQRAAAAIS